MAEQFSFRFDRRYGPLLRAFGAAPDRTSVTLDDQLLVVRFGWFTVTTPRANVAAAEVTGPHSPVKALGVRMSLVDRGLTFGSSAQQATCIRFREPVRARPFDIADHPALTVTVDRPQDLAALLNAAPGVASG